MKRILIVGLKDPAGGVESAIIEQVRHLDPIEVRTDFVIFGDKCSFEQKISEFGGRVLYMPSRVRNPKGYKSVLNSIFSNEEYDAVWCNFSGLTNIDFLVFAKKFGVPCRIAHAHTSAFAWGNILMKYLVPLFHYKNQRKIHRFATHFWACSKASGEFMFGPRNMNRVEVKKNPIDTEKYIRREEIRQKIRDEFGIGDCPVVCHVGRMCTAKNQNFLLDIFAKLVSAKPEFKLLFVGDGELNSEVTSHAEELGLGEALIFAGTRNDVPEILQASDMFLLPSVTEGLPVTAIEAQAAGLCCVVSSEAVPKETDVTGNVIFVSLNDSLDLWVDAVVSAVDRYIADGAEKVAQMGYDSVSEASKLQKFFTGDKI